MWIERILVLTLACALTACATSNTVQSQQQTRETENNEQLLLAEVSFILTQDQVVAGELGFWRVSNLYDSIRSEGLTDADIEGGQVVAVIDSMYWHNTASGNKYKQVRVALLRKGISVDPGNVVEVRYRDRAHFLRVENIRATSMQTGQCGYVRTHYPTPLLPLEVIKDIVGYLSLVGPPGGATLYCKGIENEGWAIEDGRWIKKLVPNSTNRH